MLSWLEERQIPSCLNINISLGYCKIRNKWNTFHIMYKQLLMDKERKATDQIRIDSRVTIYQTIWVKNGTVGIDSTVFHRTFHQEHHGLVKSCSDRSSCVQWSLSACPTSAPSDSLLWLSSSPCAPLSPLSVSRISIMASPYQVGILQQQRTLYSQKELSYIFPFWKCEDPTNFDFGLGNKRFIRMQGFSE